MKTHTLLWVLFTVLFTGIKLAKIINWSWIWVLSPALIMLIISLLSFIILIVMKVKEKQGPPKRSAFQERLEAMKKQRESLKK